MTSILIAYPIDSASLILGTKRINVNCLLIDLFSADKLSTEADNTVTFFIDPKMENTFMNNVVNDLQSLSYKKILTTDQQVILYQRSCSIISVMNPLSISENYQSF